MQSRGVQHQRWYKWFIQHEARVRADPGLQALLIAIEESVQQPDRTPQKRPRVAVGCLPGGEAQTPSGADGAVVVAAAADAPRRVVQSGATPARGGAALAPAQSPAFACAATPNARSDALA